MENWLNIPGEYSSVAAKSADATALLRAHLTPISKTDATAMLHKLAGAYGLPTLKIRWGAKRGRGGILGLRTREVAGTRYSYGPDGSVIEKPRYRMRRTGQSVPYVALPSQSMTLGGYWWGDKGSLLRVGLVLHEFTHVLVAMRHNYGGHGPEFVRTLDDLVNAWEVAKTAAVETSNV